MLKNNNKSRSARLLLGAAVPALSARRGAAGGAAVPVARRSALLAFAGLQGRQGIGPRLVARWRPPNGRFARCL